ncbi:hypothetical protein SRABI83_00520 [Arthrobacter sp. Bi83]|uniref:hypothetical protein n=1 Tax=Arthrobacter sp. Bi83 TaxID=2822353 RepID=UPI001D3CA2DC|nr:hypothetical protein [Arthrobacter sp. Bi83]CAH0142957.1 hypothetical protein SRABI83_00520 [Arthrobacter sp. Bi83]
MKLALATVTTGGIIAGTIWHYGNRGEFRLLHAVVSVSYLGIGVAIRDWECSS